MPLSGLNKAVLIDGFSFSVTYNDKQFFVTQNKEGVTTDKYASFSDFVEKDGIKLVRALCSFNATMSDIDEIANGDHEGIIRIKG